MSEQIIFEDQGKRARYVLKRDGAEAEVTVSKVSDQLWIVDHTGVPSQWSGQGVGKLLAQHVVEDARKAGRTLRATCPFFLAQAARHPDWRDAVKM